MTDMDWMSAICSVLNSKHSAMHYTDIAKEIVVRGLRKSLGATPAATVNATITTDINKHGDASRFKRTGRGEYLLTGGKSNEPAVPTVAPNVLGAESDSETPEPTAIRALGMFWRRDRVDWQSNPKILGEQLNGAQVVDFADQRAVYLLHDGQRTAYVGRVTDRALGLRLLEHTRDRLNGRWDRFSWFGLRGVREDGKLEDSLSPSLDVNQVIVELEAVLIESLEPPLNRRRGDGLRAIEYVQADDPSIENKRKKALLEQLSKSLGK